MEFARLIIHSLNDEGYLEENFEDLLAETELDRDDALELLQTIQFLDPVGCASRDLKECLLTQAAALEEPVPQVELLLRNHLEDLMKKIIRILPRL
jgi:RNA polymerase sigma-54 factor